VDAGRRLLQASLCFIRVFSPVLPAIFAGATSLSVYKAVIVIR